MVTDVWMKLGKRVWMGLVSAGLAAGLPMAHGEPAADVALPASAQSPSNGMVVASGVVPDEATRQAIVARLREVYGAARVSDQLTVSAVVAPPQWKEHVVGLISPKLQQVSKGQLVVKGQALALAGEVSNEAVRQQLASDIATALNPSYKVHNALRIGSNAQAALDQALAHRIIEFQPASAVLTPSGQAILTEMARVMLGMPGRKVAVLGHTDADGPRPANLALSLARAQAVKDHLVAQKVPADLVDTRGVGPDQPVASNATPEGRARNRRIEFRVLPQ